MSHPAAAFPFAYRLPTDVAVWIRDDAAATTGSPRRRRIVLVLTVLTLAGGLAATLPAGEPQAMVRQECVHDVDQGSNSTTDPLLCF